MGLFGLGLGAIVRNTAGRHLALAAIMFVLPPILGLLPSNSSNAINPYLPSNAGGAVWTITPDAHTLAPWAGFALFCGLRGAVAGDRGGAAAAARHLSRLSRVPARAPD